jgi:D-3-phosphoglycerate dehydrogenase / 2-oxoglutarate reductase
VQIGVLEPEGFSADALELLSSIGVVTLFDGQDLNRFLRPLNVLFVRLAFRIDAGILAHAPSLKYVCTPTTGHTHLDEDELARRGVAVLSLKGEREFLETIRATPEFTFGLIIALLRRFKLAFCQMQCGEWDRDRVRGFELFGRTVGIIGLGRVGARIARYCSIFGANVVFYDPAPVVPESGWRAVRSVCELIPASDVIVLCASYAKGSGWVIGREEIALLTGRYFVNTARGELVDEDTLLEAIQAGRLAGAAIDVISNETDATSVERWRGVAARGDVIVTAHVAGATVDSMASTEGFIVRKLLKRIEGAHAVS